MTQKGGAFINSFWLLDIINFCESSEVKHCVVPSTQMQIKQTNVSEGDQCIGPVMSLCVERRCIQKSGPNSSSSTHYIITDGSCLWLVHLFFSDLWQAAERRAEVYSAAAPAALYYLSIDHHTSQ